MFDNIIISERLISFLIFIPLFLLSVSVHEYAHAYIAYKKGDPTAKNLGRMTLNPLKHADLIGTLIVPLVSFFSGFALIGWAKPVPIDRRYFKNPLKDDALVSAAGPASNFLLSLVFLFLLSAILKFSINSDSIWIALLWYGVFFNVFLFLFNMLPFPPLDGSHILFDLFPGKFTAKIMSLGFYGSILLLLFIYSPLWSYFMEIVNYILKFMLTIAGV
ncbi:MAG: site-2 protease family protein [Ignavibacteriaceae bacterium]